MMAGARFRFTTIDGCAHNDLYSAFASLDGISVAACLLHLLWTQHNGHTCCVAKLRAVLAWMHDGDQKRVDTTY